MGKFVPDSWKPKDELVSQLAEKWRVEKKEILRQLEIMRDHEFRRSYTDWNRVFRNWIRKADEIDSLRRDYQRRAPEPVTEDMLKDDRKAWEEDMRRLGVSVVGSAKKSVG